MELEIVAPSVLSSLSGAMSRDSGAGNIRESSAFRCSSMIQYCVDFHSVHYHQASQSPFHTLEFQGVHTELLDQLNLLGTSSNLKKTTCYAPLGNLTQCINT